MKHIPSYVFLLVGTLLLSSCSARVQAPDATPFTVAFTGDTGYDRNDTPEIDTGFEQMLGLVKEENPDLLVILGDFTYEEDEDFADLYFSTIDRILGEDFPLLGTHGNHDDWDHYEPYFKARMNRMGLDGNLIARDKYSVVYNDIKWVLLGLHGEPEFVAEELADDEHDWKICGWHRVMRDMNAGGKGDEMGWEVYRACQDAGAIIATAHEHSYSRTLTLTDLGNRDAGHGATGEPDRMQVAPGRTFVFVSGLGGRPGRDYHCDLHDDNTWWSTIYSSNYYLRSGEEVIKSCVEDDEVVEGYGPGVLFITFNADGDASRAVGYFKTVNGEIIDQFSITRAEPDAVASQ